MIISVSHLPLQLYLGLPLFYFQFQKPLWLMSHSSFHADFQSLLWVSTGLLIRGFYGCTHEEYGTSQASLFPSKTTASLGSQFLKFENNAVLPTPWQRPLDWMFSCPAMKRLA